MTEMKINVKSEIIFITEVNIDALHIVKCNLRYITPK